MNGKQSVVYYYQINGKASTWEQNKQTKPKFKNIKKKGRLRPCQIENFWFSFNRFNTVDMKLLLT